MGLCLTRNWPNHFGSLIPRPTANLPKAAVLVVGYHWFLVGSWLVSECANRCWILQKSTRFCRNLLVFAGFDQILKRSSQISTRSHVDLDKLDKTKPVAENNNFWCQDWPGLLKISFPCSNSSTDSPMSGWTVLGPDRLGWANWLGIRFGWTPQGPGALSFLVWYTTIVLEVLALSLRH